MPNDNDAIINLRVPKHLKSVLQSLANTAGVSVSEMGRLLWERDIYTSEQEARRATDFARQVARARYGEVDAARRERHELRRLRLLLEGDATESKDGELQWVKPEGQTPVAEEVRRDAVTP